ncbi:MAG: TonB-dependent receptor [Bacteroidetes bacterium HGW-Bacteroidetes-9]|jgi:hemoglobin/transferrin/lactoferrin receptor protein|nr:MAG: TonB-dependent receptor [Bacteroidetes bacterium HGW-Bacteroidetes-9]
MKNRIYLIFSALLLLFAAQAQKVTVIDENSGQALTNVAIFNKTKSFTATTNIKGQVDISKAGESDSLVFMHLGFKTIACTPAMLRAMKHVITMKALNLSLDAVIISANRWEQGESEIPQKVERITMKQISLLNPQTSADLLSSSGKVFIQKSQQGGGSPMIRGFSTNRLLYSVDGVRMNTAIFRSGNLQNVISLDPFATEKAEILFGPGSVIYGSDAIGGVMSFQTLTPQFSRNGEVFIAGNAATRYSSANNEKTAHFDVNIGWDKWASVTSISSNDFGDLRMGSHGPDEYLRPFYVQRIDSTDVVVTNSDPRVQRPSGYSQINMMEKLRYSPNEKWDIQFGFHYSETSEYSRYDRHIRYKKGLPRYGEWSYGPQKWMMNNLVVNHTGSNKIYDQFTIRLAQQSFEESRIDRDINKDERHIRIEEVDAYSANFDFIKELSENHKLFYGFEVVTNDVNSKGIDEDISTGISALGPARYPKATWNSYAAYVSYQMKVSEKFMILAGARYNQYKLDATFDTTFYPFPYTKAEMNNGALTGSLGFVYRPAETFVINLNASTGFRSPNVDDAGKVFDSEPGSVVIPNPDLNAEFAYNAELGFAKVFSDFVKVDITGYYTILQDALVRRDFTLNGADSIMYDGTMSKVQAVQNAAVAKVYGIQAGVDVKLPSGFGFSTDYNYQIGEEELDDGTTSPSRHAPPAFGVSRFTYSNNLLTLQMYAVYSNAKNFDDLPQEEQGKTEIYAIDENGNPWSPGWYTLNFKALYQITDNFEVSAGLENLTDQRYRPYSSGIVAPGRNFIISLKARF